MYLSRETFYRAADGTVTTQRPQEENAEVLAVAGAVMSDEAARALGLPVSRKPLKQVAFKPKPHSSLSPAKRSRAVSKTTVVSLNPNSS